MQLVTIILFLSLLLFQPYSNSGNTGSKIPLVGNFKKINSNMVSLHSTSDTMPPRPPMPPVPRNMLVKASQLASDYVRNPSLADKKYKNKSPIYVEGIVKEIKEPDENARCIIILDGTPSKIDVQCERVSYYKIKNLKRGMKATFLASYCDGLNGNVILGCIYIEKPTYE